MKDELFAQVDMVNRKYGLFRAGDRVLVAVSGGIDSVTLLHVLGDPRFGIHRIAAYVHHGLRPEADLEAVEIRRTAEELGIEFYLLRLDVRGRAKECGESIEMAARAERYKALKNLARQCGATRIALGHHANDQAETVLLRLLTGTSMEGLGGMAPVSGCYIRPFLFTLRAEIERYAASHGLTWSEDASNRDPRHLRNRIRREILPLFETIQPRIVRHFSEISGLAGEWRDWIAREIDARGQELEYREEADGKKVSWSMPVWMELPLPLKRAVLKKGFYRIFPDQRLEIGHIDAMLLMAGKTGAKGRMQLPGVGYFIVDGLRMAIVETTLRTETAPFCVPVAVPGETDFPGGKLLARWVGREELPADWRHISHDEAYFDLGEAGVRWLLRNRRDGDRIRLFGHTKPEKLKKLLIDRKIPVNVRDRIPLLTDEEGVIWWAVGIQRGEAGRIGPDSRSILYLRFIRENDA